MKSERMFKLVVGVLYFLFFCSSEVSPAGTIVGWGNNDYGVVSSIPQEKDFIDIASGYNFGLALKSDGSLVGWGENGNGMFSVPAGNNFVAISAGWWHNLAIRTDGSIVRWGSTIPDVVIPAGNDFVAIAAGGDKQSLALRNDGTLIGWGYAGTQKLYSSIVPAGNDFLAIDVGQYHGIMLKSNGSLVGVSWYGTDHGQADVPTGNDFIAIDAGPHSNLVLKSDGSLVAWGNDAWGQINNVPAGNNFIDMAVGPFHSLALVAVYSVAPCADANGPYTIFVGDTLTLDGSGSTDDDNDIVSYLWDLDDDENFETDGGGQAIYDVSYAYLQSLGLIVGHTYNIQVQVTDSEGQSDVADSTLTIVPEPAIVVAVDIKPGSCPNPVNVKSSGVLPIAILGSQELDVADIVATSVRLAGIEPLRNSIEDVAGPILNNNDCNCITAGPDGFPDLTLKFETQRIIETIGEVNDGDVLTLALTGVLYDPIPFERPIEGADCIVIRGRHKPINKADINKDGVVDAIDFAIFTQNWLQSSIVEE